ncbi:MAG: hypothetical protein ACREAB_18300 [Blastocatellia bacterium]
MTLTIELPDTITEQFREREIPQKEIEAVVLAALEIWLAQKSVENGARFTESAVPFVRRLIAQNRGLFELLAQRWSGLMRESPEPLESAFDDVTAEELKVSSISHNREEETPEAKARWFQSLSLAERMEMLCFFTDLILENNPGIVDARDAQPTTRRIRFLSKA